MSKKHIVSVVVIAVVVGGAGFFGGVKYGQAKQAKAQSASRQQAFGQFRGAGGGAAGRRGGAGGGFTGGQILSKDDKSITVKTMDGSSKIVFFSPSTAVGKMVAGTASDLTVGQDVIVTGTTGSDGSITAQNIQVRSASTTPPGM